MSARHTIRRALAAPPPAVLATIDGAPVRPPADAAVIEQAERVCALLADRLAAWKRVATLTAAVDARTPPAPPAPDRRTIVATCLEVMQWFPEATPQARRAVATRRWTTERRLRTGYVRWVEDRTRLEAAFSLTEAEEVYAAASERAFAAVAVLAGMVSTTLPGLVAKAQAVAALPPLGQGERLEPSEEKLVQSVMRELTALEAPDGPT